MLLGSSCSLQRGKSLPINLLGGNCSIGFPLAFLSTLMADCLRIFIVHREGIVWVIAFNTFDKVKYSNIKYVHAGVYALSAEYIIQRVITNSRALIKSRDNP